jgi:hypothetical protein
VKPGDLGEGILFDYTVAQARAFFVFALISAFAVQIAVVPASAAGALAIGKCGAYGQAFDYPAEQSARAAASSSARAIALL